jgi:hypothetical protein
LALGIFLQVNRTMLHWTGKRETRVRSIMDLHSIDTHVLNASVWILGDDTRRRHASESYRADAVRIPYFVIARS